MFSVAGFSVLVALNCFKFAASRYNRNLVDPASSDMLISRIKPCRLKVKLRNCEWLIKPAFASLIVYCGYLLETAANTVRCATCGRVVRNWWVSQHFDDCDACLSLLSRRLKEGSDLSAFVGVVLEHRGSDGYRGIGVWFRRGSLRDGYHAQGWQQARKLPNCLFDRGSDEK